MTFELDRIISSLDRTESNLIGLLVADEITANRARIPNYYDAHSLRDVANKERNALSRCLQRLLVEQEESNRDILVKVQGQIKDHDPIYTSIYGLYDVVRFFFHNVSDPKPAFTILGDVVRKTVAEEKDEHSHKKPKGFSKEFYVNILQRCCNEIERQYGISLDVELKKQG